MAGNSRGGYAFEAERNGSRPTGPLGHAQVGFGDDDYADDDQFGSPWAPGAPQARNAPAARPVADPVERGGPGGLPADGDLLGYPPSRQSMPQDGEGPEPARRNVRAERAAAQAAQERAAAQAAQERAAAQAAQERAAAQAAQENTARRAATARTSSPRAPRAAARQDQPKTWDLSSEVLLRPVKPAPRGGWRKAVYTLSGGSVNLGDSRKEARKADLAKQVTAPLHGCYKIAVLSLKGGVGKTTVTAALGSTFASLRGDRVIAVDANPDRGTLSHKLALDTDATVRDLLRHGADIARYSEVRRYTSQSRSRLEVLASDTDPAVSEAFSARDYSNVLAVLERFYSLVLTDCGTGLMHSAMQSVLAEADALIIVSSGSVDGARSASATLDWLSAHGHDALVRDSVAVINAVRPRSGQVDLDKVVGHFAQRCRSVRLLPFDPHLEEGAEIDMDRLKPRTALALLELGAEVAQQFRAAAAFRAPD